MKTGSKEKKEKRPTIAEILRYRIPEEFKKYGDEISKSEGVDWVEMVIAKVEDDIEKLLDQAIQSERQRIIKQIKSFMKKKCIVTTKDLIADITNEIKNENKNQIL